MTARLATVVRCAGASRYLFETMRSAERQATPAETLVVVTDATTPPPARVWVAGAGARRGWTVVHVEATAPGAAWNAGIAGCDADAVTLVDAGDRLLPEHNTTAIEVLGRGVDVVVSAILHRRIGVADELVPAAPVDLPSRLTSFAAARHPWTCRRTCWIALGGLDAELPALEDHEFLLRALRRGHGVATVPAPLAVRAVRRDGPYTAPWAIANHTAAVSHIVRRHQTAITAAPEAIVVAGIDTVAGLAARNDRLVERRRAAEAELDRLRARVAELRAELPDGGHRVDLGDLRRTSPIALDWGYERGGPVDRPYIEGFLARHAADIRGAVLEVQEADYTTRFGGDRVTTSDVLDVDPANPRATIVGDLRALGHLEDDHYDCIIVTQTAHVIDDLAAVAEECARLLKPGGTVLATLPCLSRVAVEYGPDADFWRVTEAGARRLFATAFREADIEVASLGNVLTATAFLHGLGANELTTADYAVADPFNPVLVTVRATKRGTMAPVRWHRTAHVARSRAVYDHTGAGILLYHRVAAEPSDVHRLAVPPERFAQQLAYLRDEYEVVPLAELAHRVKTGAVVPGLIALTFDDGCLDNLSEAAPRLEAAGLPATFFATTAALDAPEAYWWDALEQMLLAGPDVPTADLEVPLPGGRRRFAAATLADRLAAHWAIHEAIVGLAAASRDEVVAAVAGWRGHDGQRAAARRLSAAELQALASRRGLEIGAHSVHHLMLPRQPAEVRRREVVESRAALESLLGQPVAAFAYPFGALDAATRAEVVAAGFAHAVACGEAALPRHADPYALPRLDVADSVPGRFDDWLRRQVMPPRRAGLGASRAVRQRQPGGDGRRRAVVAGWFSYAGTDATAGDFLACDLVCDWLRDAGMHYDVALAAPQAGGVDLARVDPTAYTHAVFVCGPFVRGELEMAFVERFRTCVTIGVNLSMPLPLDVWQPFDVLLERDSTRRVRPDITFAAPSPSVPVVGVCQVEATGGADGAAADRAIERLLASRELAVVPIDTRADVTVTGLRSPAEVESLIARMDVVVTTRLHGLVLALKHGVPAVAIDPEPGSRRLKAQGAAVGWPHVFTVEALDEAALAAALDACLSPEGRQMAAALGRAAGSTVEDIRDEMLAVLDPSWRRPGAGL